MNAADALRWNKELDANGRIVFSFHGGGVTEFAPNFVIQTRFRYVQISAIDAS